MSDAQVPFAFLAAISLVVAVLAGWRETRRRRRHDPDAVGWVDWTGVQALALIALAVAALLLWKAQ